MALPRKVKWGLWAAGIFVLLFLVLPFALGALLRGSAERKLREALQAPVKLGGLSVSLFPPGATLFDLELGEASPWSGSEPLARVEMLKVAVSWGTLFGAPTHITELRVRGAEVHLGCDRKGRTTLAAFLAKLPPGHRAGALSIDRFEFLHGKIVLHVPESFLAEDPPYAMEPVTITVVGVLLKGLVLPPPGLPAPREQWADLAVRILKVRAPLKGVAATPSPKEAGEPIEEGVAIGLGRLRFLLPAAEHLPVEFKDVRVQGMRVRTAFVAPGVPDTLTRILVSSKLCLKGPPPSKAEAAQAATGKRLADVLVDDSVFEISGPGGKGQPSYYRIPDLKAELLNFGIGPGAGPPKGQTGLLRISGTSRSSEGPGRVGVEWSEIRGSFPEMSFDQKLKISGVPLTPFSVRLRKTLDVGIEHGRASASFSGKTTKGRLKWDGRVTLSKSTKLSGKGYKGKIKQLITMFATGKPIQTIRIRGTLARPHFQAPDFVAGLFVDIVGKMALDKTASLWGIFKKGMASSVGQGVRETKKVFQKIGDRIGGFFGGKKEKKTQE